MSQSTGQGAASYSDVIDLDRYPIDALETERGRTLVNRCRAELAAHGVCSLPGFVTDTAVAAMVTLSDELAPKAWSSNQTHTIYFEQTDETVPAGHPRAHHVRSAKHGIAYDYIPANAPLRRLYESDHLTRFIGDVLDKPVLYRSADPLDALQITTFAEGEELGWHFDRSEFSVTVMYQQSCGGGEFVYYPNLRSAEDPNYDGVQRVLEGDDSGREVLSSAPGTLAFFHGANSLHRVSPIQGRTPRINSVLTYGERPDMRLNDLTSLLFYGRTSVPPVS